MTAPPDLEAAPGRGLRLAFAGVSHWHFSADVSYLELARAAGAEIVGLSDDDESVARTRAPELGCGWTTDVTELVERFRPDFVVALPRPDRAPEQVGRLIDLKVPLLAEKPLGRSAEDVWPLVDRAEHGWVTVAFPYRYLPIWERVERLRAAHRLGTVGHVGVRQINGPPSRYREYGVPWMLDPAVAGGGPLRNIGIHLTEIVAHQLGVGSVRIVGAARTTHMHGEPIEDFVAATLESEDGVVTTLETGYSFACARPGDMEVRIAATGAYFVQRLDELRIYPAEGDPELVPIAPGHSFHRDLFFDALRRFRRGEPPMVSVRECARANELIDEIYEAAVG
jgi:predicted dehydrogenase